MTCALLLCYQLIQEISPRHPREASELTQNRTKNRFTNILPCEYIKHIYNMTISYHILY